MNTGSPISLNSRAWRDLYKTVLFDVDKTKLPERIAQAEKALAQRARALFYAAGDNIEEREALDDAIYTPCMLCGTHRELATVYRIAVRLPRSTHRCCAIPSQGSPCVHVSPAALFVHVVEK